MTFATQNASEMAAKRGRPKADALQPEAQPEAAPERPAERTIPLVLRAGWWPYDGTLYMDPSGCQQVYRTPKMDDGTVDEMARKRTKFEPGTRIEVPASVARNLIDKGKATLDAGV